MPRLAEAERNKQLWFAVEPWMLGVAAALSEAGWLLRRLTGPQPEWRLSDGGLQTLRGDTIRQAHTTAN